MVVIALKGNGQGKEENHGKNKCKNRRRKSPLDTSDSNHDACINKKEANEQVSVMQA